MSTREAIEARLDELRRQEKEIEAERRAIYKASLDADNDAKLCDDWMARALSAEPPRWLEFPVKLLGITGSSGKAIEPERTAAKWVAVRSVHDRHGKKTYLGVLLGRIATSPSTRLSADGVLEVGLSAHNPAIYVPDLHEVLFGYESWWGAIRSPDDLKKISDADIENVWYVRALRELGSPPKDRAAQPATGDGGGNDRA